MNTNCTACHADDVHREATTLVAEVGRSLLRYGAESRVVAELARRVGLGLGLEEVEVALTASAFMVTTRINGYCITTIRQCTEHGVDLRMLSEIQQLCAKTYAGEFTPSELEAALAQIEPKHYPTWLLHLMVALSCACFSRVAGGDWAAFLYTFGAASVGVNLRRLLIKARFSHYVVAAVTAFVTTLAASLGFHHQDQAFIIGASSVLLLVPGFPLITAASDMLKGFSTMGWARWMNSSLHTLAVSLGIVAALQLLNTGLWV